MEIKRLVPPLQLDLFDRIQSQLDLDGFYLTEKNQKDNSFTKRERQAKASEITINPHSFNRLH